ncbi:Chitotriosidase-1, partial [Microtus ochrogaster]
AAKLVCFYTQTGGGTGGGAAARFLPRDIDPSLCTHLIYAFAGMDSHQLSSVEWNNKLLYQELKQRKEDEPKLKTLLAVEGWDFGTQKQIDQALLLYLDATVQLWLQKGTPASKLVLGMPTYGGSFTLASSADNRVGAPATGPGTPGPYSREGGILAYFEVSYMKQKGLGGAMVWALDLDDFTGSFCKQGQYPLIRTL